ncbi:MAG: uroporphyrinogen decarboxylase family protein [Spirochaetia bacterium]
MNRRERVMAAIELRQPDRVPLDLGSVGSLIVDPVHMQVRQLLGLKGPIAPYRSGSTTNYYDEEVLEALDIDFRHLWLASPDKPKSTKHPDGTVTDEWGITWSAEGSYPEIFPLKGATDQQLAAYRWPVTPRTWDVSALRERARRLRKETDFAIVAKSVLSGGGILERCCYLRSIEDLFIDMSINKDAAHFIVDKVVEAEIAMWDLYLDAVGPYIDIVQRASDLGTQTGLFISPPLYREFLKPAEDKVYRHIRSRAPQVKTWFHSCGAIMELIDDFLDIGVQILNPVQPLATGMDSRELKRRYGKKLCFHGGIDLQKALPGTIDDVRKEVETRIRAMGECGGYILAPANHIQKDTPAENVVFLYRYAKEFGKHPVK